MYQEGCLLSFQKASFSSFGVNEIPKIEKEQSNGKFRKKKKEVHIKLRIVLVKRFVLINVPRNVHLHV